MLYNLAALRESLRLEDIRDFAGRKLQSFLLPDQDILTAVNMTKAPVEPELFVYMGKMAVISKERPSEVEAWSFPLCAVTMAFATDSPMP